jgi:hypothetical protein
VLLSRTGHPPIPKRVSPLTQLLPRNAEPHPISKSFYRTRASVKSTRHSTDTPIFWRCGIKPENTIFSTPVFRRLGGGSHRRDAQKVVAYSSFLILFVDRELKDRQLMLGVAAIRIFLK